MYFLSIFFELGITENLLNPPAIPSPVHFTNASFCVHIFVNASSCSSFGSEER
jgi:hypothetical protein